MLLLLLLSRSRHLRQYKFGFKFPVTQGIRSSGVGVARVCLLGNPSLAHLFLGLKAFLTGTIFALPSALLEPDLESATAAFNTRGTAADGLQDEAICRVI